jgi:hypothetical protein
MTTPTPPAYPESFYVAHKLFDIQGVKQWGDILDGPVGSYAELIEIVIENFRDEKPSRDNLRVLWVSRIGVVHDATAYAINVALARMGGDNE